MATIDLTVTAATGSNAGYLPDRSYQLWEGPPTRVRRRVFFVGQPDWGGLTPTAGDIVRTQVIDLGVHVVAVYLNVLTAGAASSTVSVGDTLNSTTQYLANVSTAATGTFLSTAASWKWYPTASDFLIVTLGTTAAATGAVIDVGFLGSSFIPYTNPVTE
jgi:hypothetical protein